MDPVKPVDPVCPIKPVCPVKPVAPVGPVNPVLPVWPVDPVFPVEPVCPVDPVNPVTPVEPVDPVCPVEPVDPFDPVGPTDPCIPGPVIELMITALKIVAVSHTEISLAIRVPFTHASPNTNSSGLVQLATAPLQPGIARSNSLDNNEPFLVPPIVTWPQISALPPTPKLPMITWPPSTRSAGSPPMQPVAWPVLEIITGPEKLEGPVTVNYLLKYNRHSNYKMLRPAGGMQQ